MQVRRVAGAFATTTFLVLMSGSAWADESPSPDPTPVVEQTPVPDPANPGCFFVDPGGDTPTDDGTVTPEPEPTDVPPVEGSGEPDPGSEPTDAPTDEPTDVPTDEPTDVPTDEPTDVPTDEPTDEPTDAGDPTYVCLAYTTGAADGGVAETPTLGSGAVDLPRTGGSVNVLAATGLLLVASGASFVVASRRRTT